MLENVRADVERCLEQVDRRELDGSGGGGCSSSTPKAWRVARTILGQYGLQALLVYRLGRWVRGGAGGGPARALAAALTPALLAAEAYVRLAYDVHLDTSAEIGPGLFVSHIGDIRVRGCRLGAGCSIHHRVQIEPRPGEARGPVIGDAVWIGPHASIRGPLRIGDRATVAAAAVVTSNVPPRSFVAGAPARVAAVAFDNQPML